MRFGDLTPGQHARIPGAPTAPTPIAGDLPPAVQILTAPAPCPRCPAVEVLARDVDGGRPRLYHRLPGRRVVLIELAKKEAV